MKITRAAEYAVRCVLYMARKGRDVLVTRYEVSEYADIPPKFLAKIAQDLARAHLISIKQGPKGGFVLSKDPEEITLLQVVEIMIGEIHLNDCTHNPKGCRASSACSVNQVWLQAKNQLRETLSAVTFSALMKKKSCILDQELVKPMGQVTGNE